MDAWSGENVCAYECYTSMVVNTMIYSIILKLGVAAHKFSIYHPVFICLVLLEGGKCHPCRFQRTIMEPFTSLAM